MDNFQELFALPIGLKPALKIRDIQLYTSDTIKEKYKDAISKSRVTSKISKEINTLVDEGKIIPCFASSGMISFIKNKMIYSTKNFLQGKIPIDIFSDSYNSLILGVYMFPERKLVIIIDNTTSFTSSNRSDNDIIGLVTVHELMHMVATEVPSNFVSAYQDELTSFYREMMSFIFKLQKVPDKVIQSLYKFFSKLETVDSFKLSDIVTKLDSLQKYSTLSKRDFLKASLNYIRCINTWIKDPNLYKRKIESDFLRIYRGIQIGYKKTYGKTPTDTLFCQEMIFPSEVIAIGSEITIPSKTSKLIRSVL